MVPDGGLPSRFPPGGCFSPPLCPLKDPRHVAFTQSPSTRFIPTRKPRGRVANRQPTQNSPLTAPQTAPQDSTLPASLPPPARKGVMAETHFTRCGSYENRGEKARSEQPGRRSQPEHSRRDGLWFLGKTGLGKLDVGKRVVKSCWIANSRQQSGRHADGAAWEAEKSSHGSQRFHAAATSAISICRKTRAIHGSYRFCRLSASGPPGLECGVAKDQELGSRRRPRQATPKVVPKDFPYQELTEHVVW